MTINVEEISALDRASVLHPFTQLKDFATGKAGDPTIVETGKGIRIKDAMGREYIDGFAGLYCVNIGYGRNEVAEAISRQAFRLAYYHSYAAHTTDELATLSARLVRMAPGRMSKVFYGMSGSDANETQAKLVWYYNNLRGLPKKKKIISRQRAYHGVTIASASLTGLPWVHSDFDLPIANILHTSCPHHYRFAEAGETEDQFTDRMAKDLDDLIQKEGPDTVAAFIAEPIMGAGGVIIPPKSYFAKINAVLAKYDVRIIADEVICGFGRTGEWFGTTAMGMKPTSISMAKAITSAYFPMGAITIEEELYQAMLDESRKIGTFGHGFTYTAHPVGCAVALKTIEIYERDKTVEHVRKVASTFERRIASFADHPLVGDTRAKGLIGAIELVADKKTKRAFDPKKGVGALCADILQENGLIVRSMGDAVAFCPPLIIMEDEINEMFDIMAKGLRILEERVLKENLRN